MRKTIWTRSDMFFFAWLFAMVFCGMAAAAIVTNASNGWMKHHPLSIGGLAMVLSLGIAWLLSRPRG
jgi:hypothetical protein